MRHEEWHFGAVRLDGSVLWLATEQMEGSEAAEVMFDLDRRYHREYWCKFVTIIQRDGNPPPDWEIGIHVDVQDSEPERVYSPQEDRRTA